MGGGGAMMCKDCHHEAPTYPIHWFCGVGSCGVSLPTSAVPTWPSRLTRPSRTSVPFGRPMNLVPEALYPTGVWSSPMQHWMETPTTMCLSGLSLVGMK